MDTKRLETIRITALQHVQRYNLAYPSSTTCRPRHERSLLRFREPCTRELLRYRRFASKVTRRSEGAAPIYAFDLIEAAIDAALLELLIDGCKKRLAGSRAFVEEANKAMRPGPALKNRSRSKGYESMKLTERKRIFIDIRRAQHPEATFASPPDHLSLMQAVLNLDSVVERECRVHSLGVLGVLCGSNAFSSINAPAIYASGGCAGACAACPPKPWRRWAGTSDSWFIQYARRIYMT